jgi:hypothetical protein
LADDHASSANNFLSDSEGDDDDDEFLCLSVVSDSDHEQSIAGITSP